MTRYVEDSWVMAATGRIHQVFAVNWGVLTQCGKWLTVDSVRPSTAGPPYPPVSANLCKSCERGYHKATAS